MITVNGPWFVSETRMSAPNRPVSTCAPSARKLCHDLVHQRFGHLAGRGGVPGGAGPAGVPVESELRNHQERRVHIRTGLLALQDAHRPELAGQLRRLLRGVVMGDPDQHTQALTDDLPDGPGGRGVVRRTGDGDARAVHSLYHCTHTDQPILG